MRVRCGACRTEFDVAGAGRYACPVCGSVNVVRDATAPPGAQTVGGYPTAPGVSGNQAPSAPPPPQPDVPLPKIECPECGFGFIVGKIAVATCPNCSAEVETGLEVAEDGS